MCFILQATYKTLKFIQIYNYLIISFPQFRIWNMFTSVVDSFIGLDSSCLCHKSFYSSTGGICFPAPSLWDQPCNVFGWQDVRKPGRGKGSRYTSTFEYLLWHLYHHHSKDMYSWPDAPRKIRHRTQLPQLTQRPTLEAEWPSRASQTLGSAWNCEDTYY